MQPSKETLQKKKMSGNEIAKVTHASHKLLLREPVTYRKHLKVSNFFFQNMFNSNFEANIHSVQCF